MDNHDFKELLRSPSRRLCVEHALVLRSVNIPHHIAELDADYALMVAPEFFSQATEELRSYIHENRDWRQKPEPAIKYNGWPGVLAYVVVLFIVSILVQQGFGGYDWFDIGRLESGLVFQGEWWRTITALTLHADVGHLASNLGFGALFGYFAGQLVGPGFAWFVVVISAAVGNGANAWLHGDGHSSVGASTAVFAALGLLSAVAWVRRQSLDHRWAYRLAPLVGGVVLLAYTGLGGERTDVGAHVAGFAVGLASGTVYALGEQRTIFVTKHQWLFGNLAIAVIVVGWLFALWRATS